MSTRLLVVTLLALAACRSAEPRTSRYPRPIPTAATGPVLFSPGWVSSGLAERDAAFTSDGNVFAFTQLDGTRGVITLLERGQPRIAPFSGEFSDLEPFFDPRDGALWFASNRPHPDDPERRDWNIWRVAREVEGWGAPALVRGLDGPGDEYYPTVALDGTVAFTAERPFGRGGEDIWLAFPDGVGDWAIENAGRAVNGPGSEYNALLAPRGDLLIFSSERADRPGDQGGGDLYASARRVGPRPDPGGDPGGEAARDTGGEGAASYFEVEPGPGSTWGEAVPLAPYNSPALDYCPALTPDGLYLVFTSRREVQRPRSGPETFPELRARLLGPGNGRDDLWWALAPTVRRDERP